MDKDGQIAWDTERLDGLQLEAISETFPMVPSRDQNYRQNRYSLPGRKSQWYFASSSLAGVRYRALPPGLQSRDHRRSNDAGYFIDNVRVTKN